MRFPLPNHQPPAGPAQPPGSPRGASPRRSSCLAMTSGGLTVRGTLRCGTARPPAGRPPSPAHTFRPGWRQGCVPGGQVQSLYRRSMSRARRAARRASSAIHRYSAELPARSLAFVGGLLALVRGGVPFGSRLLARIGRIVRGRGHGPDGVRAIRAGHRPFRFTFHIRKDARLLRSWPSPGIQPRPRPPPAAACIRSLRHAVSGRPRAIWRASAPGSYQSGRPASPS